MITFQQWREEKRRVKKKMKNNDWNNYYVKRVLSNERAKEL